MKIFPESVALGVCVLASIPVIAVVATVTAVALVTAGPVLERIS